MREYYTVSLMCLFLLPCWNIRTCYYFAYFAFIGLLGWQTLKSKKKANCVRLFWAQSRYSPLSHFEAFFTVIIMTDKTVNDELNIFPPFVHLSFAWSCNKFKANSNWRGKLASKRWKCVNIFIRSLHLVVPSLYIYIYLFLKCMYNKDSRPVVLLDVVVVTIVAAAVLLLFVRPLF